MNYSQVCFPLQNTTLSKLTFNSQGLPLAYLAIFLSVLKQRKSHGPLKTTRNQVFLRLTLHNHFMFLTLKNLQRCCMKEVMSLASHQNNCQPATGWREGACTAMVASTSSGQQLCREGLLPGTLQLVLYVAVPQLFLHSQLHCYIWCSFLTTCVLSI